MNIGRKIKELRESKKPRMTQADLAKKVGVTSQTISDWERGLYSPSSEYLPKIAAALEVTPSVLVGESREVDAKYLLERKLLPVVSSILAGDPGEYIEPGYANEYIICPIDVQDEHAFALRIQGHSMCPSFLDGDYVIASPGKKPVPNHPAVAKMNDGQATCKIYKETGKFVQLIPVNPEFEMIVCHKKDLAWIYPVVGMYRKVG